MNPQSLWRALGVPAGLAAGLIAVSLVGAAEPTRDFSVVFPDEARVVPDGRSSVLRGLALDGSDLERVTADLAGAPVPLVWSEQRFDALLPPLPPGAYPLRMGIVHQGGVRREFTVPVIVGPFATRGEWIDSAISVQLALTALDSHGAQPGDLASALSRKIVAMAPGSQLGPIVRCPITIRTPSAGSSFVLGGDAVFERGAVAFTIPLTFRRPTRQTLAIGRAGPISAVPDERALQIGRDQGGTMGGGVGAAVGFWAFGPVGALLGAALGQMGGQAYGEGEARSQARTQLEHLVDGFLPRVSEAMALPEQLSLDPQLPNTTLHLRFHAPPRFVDGAGLVVRIDAQLESFAQGRVPGPLALEASEQLLDAQESGVVASPAFVAALVDVYGTGGGAERDFARLSHDGNAPRRVGPLELRGTHLTLAPMVLPRALPGTLAWAVPDLALTTNLPLDVRVFATGTISARLAEDGRRVLMQPAVGLLQVSCRSHQGAGWTFLPCLSDATNAFPDAPALVSKEIKEVPMFAEVLGPLVDSPLGAGTDLSVRLQPSRLELGDRAGAPRAALAATVTFEAR